MVVAASSVHTLSSAGTLKEVAVAGARAPEDAAVALLRAAQRNNSLQLLDLRGVPLGTEVRLLSGCLFVEGLIWAECGESVLAGALLAAQQTREVTAAAHSFRHLCDQHE
jgi:hypothetical protein